MTYDRPTECCGICPQTLSGEYDCTCLDDPRCPKFAKPGEGDPNHIVSPPPLHAMSKAVPKENEMRQVVSWLIGCTCGEEIRRSEYSVAHSEMVEHIAGDSQSAVGLTKVG